MSHSVGAQRSHISQNVNSYQVSSVLVDCGVCMFVATATINIIVFFSNGNPHGLSGAEVGGGVCQTD